MQKFFSGVVRFKKTIISFFFLLTIICLFLAQKVAVNYDINDYLPDDTHSTVSINIMENEFEGGIPNARAMVSDVSIPEALSVKEELENVEGVTSVLWLDDSVDVTLPLSSLDQDTVETYYKDNTALFTITIKESEFINAVADIREIIGEDNALEGTAVSTADATTKTVSEVMVVTVIAVLFVLFVLTLTTHSWAEPFIILIGLGVAIAINNGTNLIFGEISFITNAAGSVLQLAVSLDYSVFLLHRFEECKQEQDTPAKAMVDALCKSISSISSSGLTTVIGFLALVLMRFKIGPDLGLALAKGVAISLIVVFLFMPAFILVTQKWINKTKHRYFMPSFRGLGKVVQKIAVPMAFLFALVIVPSYIASSANGYYYGASHIFGEDTQLGADTAKIQKVFGENDSYVLMVPAGDTAKETKLSYELHELPEVKNIISYVDLAGAEIPLSYLDENTLSQLISDNYSRMVISSEIAYEGEETFALVQEIRDIAEKYYPGEYYLAGQGVSTYDLMKTVTADMTKVNLIAIAAVFFVLVLTLKSVSLPAILVLSIETAIWLNLSIPYFYGSNIFYLAYLIISSIQLGATVDYAILMTDRYKENRQTLPKKEAVVQTISDVTVSILTSGLTLTVVGFLLSGFSSNQLLAQLGLFIGRGAVFSLSIVIFVLPGVLYIFDRVVLGKKHKSFKEVIAHEK